MASIPCPHCGAKLNVPEAALGKSGRCPKCQTKCLVQLPKPEDEYELAPLEDPAPLAPAPLRDRSTPTPSLPSAARPLGPRVAQRDNTESAGMGNEQQKLLLLVGGGILSVLALLVVIGGIVFVVVRNVDRPSGGSSWNGRYAVVDSLDSPPAVPAEERAPPLDVEYVSSIKNATAPKDATASASVPAKGADWSVKPNSPLEDEQPPADVVGALSPEPSLLLASLGGPYAVGVPPDPQRARRAKALKGADGRPGELVSIDKEPHPVIDFRTGKSAGQFPAEAQIRFSCRLSPDGRYLVSWAFELQQEPEWKVTKDELVVWERDADKPACRWPLPGAVLWADFLEPNRLALYHTSPSPQFVILDVTKGTPVITAPLPADDFSAEHDFNPRKDASSYRVQAASGAVSPSRKLIALGGRTNIVLLEADGRVAGKLPVERVSWARNYLGMSFNEDGTQLRALTQQGGGGIYLRVWSLADGHALFTTRYFVDPRAGQEGMLDFVPPLQILSGPEPDTLFIGDKVFSLTAGQVFAELPYQPQRRLDANRLLALGTLEQAHNANELGATADFVPRGQSLIVAALDREALVPKAPKPDPAAVAIAPSETPALPTPEPADRSKVTAIRLKPPEAWAVKTGAEVARPAGPLPLWPHAFAGTEAAFITEGLSWIRYDLNTGNTIGSPIELWPGQPPPSGPAGWHTAALTRDGQRLALIDAKDRGRVDVWDIRGKRLVGLSPNGDGPILWHAWSADGKLLTADGGHLSAWDVQTGQAAFEIEGNFARFSTAPDAKWVIAMTPARHLFFVDTATGQCLGHIPASPSFPEHTLSPDSKTLIRFGQRNMQVWDLETGQRKSQRETPLVPLTLAIGAGPQVGVTDALQGPFWIDARRLLSHTQSPAELQHPRYFLYDLDVHTHTYGYPANLGTLRNDSLGRAWMTSRAAGSEAWIAPKLPGAGPFDHALAFGPGTTVRIEVDVGSRKASQQTAEKVAASLAAQGFKIGRDGWVLRADHTAGTASTDLTNLRGQGGISVATLHITWRLLDPEGKEAWKGTRGGKFDPFNSKYVVVGSRRTDMAAGGLGGGSTEVRLDYQGKDAMTAQVEEILEQCWFPGVPTCLVQSEGGYVALPLAAPEKAQEKP